MSSEFKFIEATFPELEDDSYEFIANENFHIQCCEDGQYVVQQLKLWDTDEAYIQTLYSCNILQSAMKFIITLNGEVA